MPLGSLKTTGIAGKSRFVIAIDPANVSSSGVTIARAYDYTGSNIGPAGDGGDGYCATRMTVGASVTFGTTSWGDGTTSVTLPYMHIAGGDDAHALVWDTTNDPNTSRPALPALVEGGSNTALGFIFVGKLTSVSANGNNFFDNFSTNDGQYGMPGSGGTVFRVQSSGSTNIISTTSTLSTNDQVTLAFYIKLSENTNCAYLGRNGSVLAIDTSNFNGQNAQEKISQIQRIGKASQALQMDLSMFVFYFDDYGSGAQSARTTDLAAVHADPYGSMFTTSTLAVEDDPLWTTVVQTW